MRQRGELFDYQQEAVRLMVEKRQLACFLTPGRGKTAITLTALSDLKVRRVLVLAPAMVVSTNVWGREAASWRHLGLFNVRAIEGRPEMRKALLAYKPDATETCVDVISYDNFVWLTENCDLARYDAIVMDELSKLKHPGTVRFRRFRSRAMGIPIRFGLTGTPVGNRLEDVWGEMFATCGDKPLGGSKVLFLPKYFIPIKVAQSVYIWRPMPHAEAEIHKAIKPYAFTLAAGRGPAMPELRINSLPVPVPEAAERMARELADQLRVRLADGETLTALSGSALGTKLRQHAGGAVYNDAGSYSVVHDAKLTAVQDIIDELQGEPAVLFYWYHHERERLQKTFKGAVEIHDRGAVDRWNRREIPLLLAHPASAGHGINLQHGGFNVIWFSLPWSLEMWEQSNGRLVRQGQPSSVVMAHIPMAGAADAEVLAVLTSKRRVQDNLMAAVTHG